MRSHLLEGKVRHRRSRPVVYAMEHGVYYLALDLAELDEVDRTLRLVSHNRPNALEFRDGPPCWRTCAPRARTRPAGASRW